MSNLFAAAAGNIHLLNTLQDIQSQLELINGGPVVPARKPTNPVSAQPPTNSPFTVVGNEGKFVIDITPPQNIVYPSQAQKNLAGAQNLKLAQVYYQLRCADDEAMSTGLITYGVQTQIHTEILMPNSFKFWQLRSQYANSTWTSWQPFTDPSVCGPIQVWSGVITSSDTSLVNQGSSYLGSSPLTQDGTSTKIDVAASVWHAGNENISYGAGSVDPGSYGLWYVFADDPARAGGNVIYQATSDVSVLVALDGRLYFGSITTASGGGGSGGGGGGGACCSGPTLITMADGSKKAQSDVRVGDQVLGIDGGIDNVVSIEMFAGMPCFTNTFDNGYVTSPISSRHPFKYFASGFVLNCDALVGDDLTSDKGTTKLSNRSYAGLFTVYGMALDRSFTFWADGMASHNSRFSGK